MSTIEILVRRYIECFNATDAAKRRALVDELYTDDCSYTDPYAAVTGRDGVDAYLAGVQQQFPGIVFSLAGAVDTHHDQARFTWHAGPPGATEPVAVGFDVAVLHEGRVRQVLGFIDRAPG